MLFRSIVLWISTAGLLAAWTGLSWGVHALLADPQAAVLAAQRAVHALPTLADAGAAAMAARDALVNALDAGLLLLGALAQWTGPLAGPGWTAACGLTWLLGSLLLLTLAVLTQRLVAESARITRMARAAPPG